MSKVEQRVFYYDTDAGQVVYYSNYFKWFERGRRQIFSDFSISLIELEKHNLIIPVVEAHCNYYFPARYDDIIIVETKITEIKDKTIRFNYQILRKEDKKLLAEGYTINIFVDKTKMRSVPIPEGIKEKIRLN